MPQGRKFSTELKREAVQLIWDSNLSIKQIATDRRLYVNIVSLWCREQPRDGAKAFRDQGIPREEELVRLKLELLCVEPEWGHPGRYRT